MKEAMPLGLLRRGDLWVGQGGAAVAPILVVLIAGLASDLGAPALTERGVYSAASLAALVVLAGGSLVGLRRGFPLWSYAWVTLAIQGTVTLASSLMVAFPDGLVESRTQLGLLLAGLRVAGTLLLLAFAVSRCIQGLQYGLWAIAVTLAAGAVQFPIVGPSPLITPLAAAATTGAVGFISALQLVLVAAVVMRFLRGDAEVQKKCLYIMAAIVFLDPVLTGWANIWFVLDGVAWWQEWQFVGTFMAGRWVYALLLFGITWGLGRAIISMRNRRQRPEPVVE